MTRHFVDDRWVDVNIPDSLQGKQEGRQENCKIFVARVGNGVSQEDMREHFEKFGKITDLFYPEPFRGFAFVTFLEAKVAQSLVGKDHIINGCSVHIGAANPKKGPRQQHGGRPSPSGWGNNRGRDRPFSVDPWMF